MNNQYLQDAPFTVENIERVLAKYFVTKAFSVSILRNTQERWDQGEHHHQIGAEQATVLVQTAATTYQQETGPSLKAIHRITISPVDDVINIELMLWREMEDSDDINDRVEGMMSFLIHEQRVAEIPGILKSLEQVNLITEAEEQEYLGLLRSREL